MKPKPQKPPIILCMRYIKVNRYIAVYKEVLNSKNN